MSKYTSGFLFAAAGPLLYRRAAVNAKEQNFILFDRSNIFINSLWCNNSTQVDQQWQSRLHAREEEADYATGSSATFLARLREFFYALKLLLLLL